MGKLPQIYTQGNDSLCHLDVKGNTVCLPLKGNILLLNPNNASNPFKVFGNTSTAIQANSLVFNAGTPFSQTVFSCDSTHWQQKNRTGKVHYSFVRKNPALFRLSAENDIQCRELYARRVAFNNGVFVLIPKEVLPAAIKPQVGETNINNSGGIMTVVLGDNAHDDDEFRQLAWDNMDKLLQPNKEFGLDDEPLPENIGELLEVEWTPVFDAGGVHALVYSEGMLLLDREEGPVLIQLQTQAKIRLKGKFMQLLAPKGKTDKVIIELEPGISPE